MTTVRRPEPGPREPSSHIDRDGNPKRAYETQQGAAIAAGRLEIEQKASFTWYVCAQRPEHWHVARVRPRPGARP